MTLYDGQLSHFAYMTEETCYFRSVVREAFTFADEQKSVSVRCPASSTFCVVGRLTDWRYVVRMCRCVAYKGQCNSR